MSEWLYLLSGFYRVRLEGAAPEQALNRLTAAHIPFWDIERLDDFALEISIRKKDLEAVEELAAKAQGQAEPVRECGLPQALRGLRKRKAFLLAVGLILAAAYILPGYIWCLDVEGNQQVPDEVILRELAELGIGFGTRCSTIVPQKLKNEMLVRIPQLEWLTVNHTGGLATVVVRERESGGPIADRRQVTNLVANRDCIITQMDVLSGQAVRRVGQSVLAGDLLVSGYADWEHCVQATQALGEIYGITSREQNAVTPVTWELKGEPGTTHTRWAVIFGRRRINFFRNSGIWAAGCDKMTIYHPLTLPGGYTFPVTLVEERSVERETRPADLEPETARALLRQETAAAVRSDMVAGQILGERLQVRRRGGVYRLTGDYACQEMVARSVPAILWEGEENP